MGRLGWYSRMALIIIMFLYLADPWDRLLSEWLRLHALPGFASFMDRSIFEGEGLGAGDFAVFLQIATLVLSLASFLPLASMPLRRWRAPLSYIVATSLLTAFWVHLIKGVLARPRPADLELATSSWQGVSERLLHGWGQGSFPSGHTAASMSLIAFCYALHAMDYRRTALIAGVLCVLFAISMALSRIMIGAHWPTDTLGAMTLGWFLAHRGWRTWQEKLEREIC